MTTLNIAKLPLFSRLGLNFNQFPNGVLFLHNFFGKLFSNHLTQENVNIMDTFIGY